MKTAIVTGVTGQDDAYLAELFLEKAKKELGWEPSSSLEELGAMMVEADLHRVKSGISF